MKRVLSLIIFFYILTLIQTSFLIHFKTFLGWEIGYSLILIALILINFLEKPEKNLGILSAPISGFFLDIFSENFIGFHILILLGVSLFIKFILRKYVRPVIRRGSPVV